MSRTSLLRALYFFAIFTLLIGLLSVQAQPARGSIASTPPMGWNSWDAYGLTIDEAQFRDNVKVLAEMKQYGWQYAVIDEGWYMRDPFADSTAKQGYLYDENGLLLPVVERFPSSANNAGFKALAEWVHSLGLKFGIHIVRGIPKQVVEQNLPIAGSSFHAADAADRDATCPWNDANFGVADNAAGQAYYDSMLKRYADWGVDYIKVDCISDHPYRPTEIRQVAEAIRKTGRPMVLSLSPGPTRLQDAEYVAKYAQMWRITDDHWDVWMEKNKGKDSEFPFGLKEEFDRIATWNKHVKPGSWPDPDMLPLGSLTPHPGWGEPRQSHYTQDEERTEFTLWAVSRSPLIFGGNLTKLDEFTRGLMTNEKVIKANQWATASHPLSDLPAGFDNVRVWETLPIAIDCPARSFAFFNVSDSPITLHFKWNEIVDQKSSKRCPRNEVEDLWTGKRSRVKDPMALTLPAHGSTMYQFQ